MTYKTSERSREYARERYANEPGFKEKRLAQTREWRAKNPSKAKGHGLKRHYGISYEEYERLFKEQNGLCAICKGIGGQKGLFIDHNHEDGVVRSLLCQHCNFGIGHFKEDITLLARAIEYLEYWK